MKKHLIWIDWMKALLMLVVIWGHCFPEGLEPFIYAFNVSAFFVVSGFLARKRSWTDSWPKLLSTIIIPYLIFCILKDAAFLCKNFGTMPFWLCLRNILIGTHSTDTALGCNTLWYVYTLLLLRVLSCWIPVRKSIVIPLCAILLALAWGYNHYFQTEIKSSWLNLLVAAPCYFAGWIVGNTPNYHTKVENFIDEQKQWGWGLKLACLLTTIAVLFILSSWNGCAWMYEGGYGKSITMFLVCSALGTFLCLSIANFLSGKTTPAGVRLISIGTIAILCFHRDVIHPFLKLVNGLELPQWATNTGSFLCSVLTLLIFIPIIWILSKYLPWILGKKK